MGVLPTEPVRRRFRRPPWPLGTRAWRRHRWLLWAVLLPLVFVGTLRVSLWAGLELEPYDRATVWASGTPQALDLLGLYVANHGIFAQGHRTLAGPSGRPPRGCETAEAFSFSRLRDYELQAAASELRALAQKAGARPCGGNEFVFDDHPGVFSTRALPDVLPQIAWLAAVPLLAVLLVAWGLSERLKLPVHRDARPCSSAALARGLLTGLVLGAASVALQFVLRDPGMPPSDGISAPAGLATWGLLLLVFPFLHELSFRAWAQSLAARTLGRRGAIAFTTLLALALFQAPLASWPGMIATSVGLGWLYDQSQSLPACVLAQAILVAMGLCLA